MAVGACRSCGEALTANDRFCPKCGTPAGGATPTSGAVPYSPWTQVLERVRAATAGEFQVMRELGRGGMAAVYLAQEVALNRLVAIKVMAPGVMMGEGMVDRFRQEAVTVANLSHPNIITIHTVRQLDDLHFFVMKFVDGQPLDVILRQSGVLPIPIVRAILFQVGSGLAYAHRRGVIHRDVKPANVLLDRDGNAIVTDFGIAKVAEVPGHTKTGTMVGTPAYMSPEQCVAETVTGASDQYSLGIVAYELLTGAPPFAGSSYAIMQGHLEKQPASIRGTRADCPPDLDIAVLRMLGKTPLDRFTTIPEALQALGARPLTDDDPLRADLEALVGPSAAADMARPSALPSPVPRTPAPPTMPMPKAARVVISELPASVEPGDEFRLSATVTDAAGRPMPARTVSWSSAAPGIATVGADGEVTVVGEGTTTLTAKADGVAGSLELRVTPLPATTIELSAPSLELAVGDSLPLAALARNRLGAAVGDSVRWSTSDPAIALISADGIVTGRGAGTIRATAAAGDATAAIELAVRPAAVASVRLASPPRPIVAGDRFTLRATPSDARGNALADRVVGWSSGDDTIARVSDAGIVTTLISGSVTVVAECEGQRGSVELVVSPVPVAAVTVGAPADPIEIGATVQLSAGVYDAAGGVLERPVEWKSSHPKIAGVSPEGIVTALAAGKATLTATSERISGAARLQVRAAPKPAREDAVTPAAAPGGRRKLWLLAPVGVAAAVAVLLISRGGKQPPAPLPSPSAPAHQGEPAPAPASAPVTTIAVSPPTLGLSIGDGTRLAARLLDAGGRPVPGGRVLWSSSDARVATVDSTGRVTGLRAGMASITVAGGGRTASVPVTVRAAAGVVVATITVATPAPITEGDSAVLRAVVRDSGGKSMTGKRVVWSSDRPEIAAVDRARGLVEGKKAGRAIVTVMVDGVTSTVPVTISARATLPKPEPGPVPAIPSVAGADAAVRAVASECFAAIRSVDAARMAQLYGAVSGQDKKNADKLLTLMRRKEWAFSTTTGSVSVSPQSSGDAAFGDFSAQLVWKNSFGHRREITATFRATAQRAGGGWQPASCRLQGTPDL